MNNTRAGYHPLQVGLHWLIVVLVTAAFVLGRVMSGMPTDAAKVPLLTVHISVGILIVLAMIVRLVARRWLPQPPPATAGNVTLDRIGRIVHYLLYALVFLMGITGFSLALQADLLPIVFGGASTPLPADFFVYRARALHALLSKALLATVLVHVGGALYHEIILKDRLLRRMWFARPG